MIDASPVTTPDTREFPDLPSACARMDTWGLSEVAKVLCGAVGTYIKSQGRPVSSCSRCAPGAGGGIGCALSGKKWNQPQSKRKHKWTFKKVSFQFFLLLTLISSSRICSESSILQTSLSEKDDLSSWSPSREKLRRIQRIDTLILPLLQRDYYKRKTCPHLLSNLSLCLCSGSSTFFSLLPSKTAKIR